MPRKQRDRSLAARETAMTVITGGRTDAPIPPYPSVLSAKQRERWTAFWSSPLVRVVVPEIDVDTIETLFVLRTERERSLRAATKQRLVPGSHNQPVLNPLFDLALKLQKEIRTLEDRVGLNPKARFVLGTLFGDAARSIDDLNADLDRDADIGDLLDDDDVALDR